MERVCIVGDGAAAWSAAYRLVRHRRAAGVLSVTLLSAGEARSASSVVGLFSRHGCPNLARWYDELHLGLVPHGTHAADTLPGVALRRRVGKQAMAMLARELQHDPDAAASHQQGLDGTIADFCARVAGESKQAIQRWLLPLVGSVWGLPPAEAASVSARLALRVLFENGLLVDGGDGSGHDPTVWWALRPAGGWTAVRARTQEWLGSHGVSVLHMEHAEADSLTICVGASASSISYGETKLGPFEHVILAMDPAGAARALERGMQGTQASVAWLAALQQLALHSVQLQLTVDANGHSHQGADDAAMAHTYLLRDLQNGDIGPWQQQPSATLRIRRSQTPTVSTLTEMELQGSVLGPSAAGAQAAVEALHLSQRHQSDGAGSCLWYAHELLQDGLPEGAVVSAIKVSRALLTLAQTADECPAVDAPASALLSPGSVLPPAGACYTPERGVATPPCPLEIPAWRCRLHLCFSGRTAHRRPGPMKGTSPTGTSCPAGATAAAEMASSICPAGGAAPHTFQYSVRYDWTNVDAGHRQWWGGLVREDHFGDPAIALGEAIRALVAQEIGVWVTGPIDLLGSLRECGYCFNPICLYYCWAEVKRHTLLCVVAATTNTPWGQRHLHVLPIECAMSTVQDHGHVHPTKVQEGTHNRHVLRREKRLHVSPFNPPPNGKASWKYIVDVPDAALDRVSIGVTAYADVVQNQETMQVAATLALTRRRSAGGGWLFQECEWIPRLPYSLLVQYRIHWQAVLLFRKGLAMHDNTTCPLATNNVAISHGFMAGLVLLTLGAGLWTAWQGVSLLTETALAAYSDQRVTNCSA